MDYEAIIILSLNSKRGIITYRGKSFSTEFVRPYITKCDKYDEPSIILVLGYEGVGVLKFPYMGLQNYASTYDNIEGKICSNIGDKVVVDFGDRNRQITFVAPEGIELGIEEVTK